LAADHAAYDPEEAEAATASFIFNLGFLLPRSTAPPQGGVAVGGGAVWVTAQ
jgi:hypothetical protein